MLLIENAAPPDCLQYMTAGSGTVKSFNWKDVAPSASAPRQLADQDYKICFRAELFSNNQVLVIVAVDFENAADCQLMRWLLFEGSHHSVFN